MCAQTTAQKHKHSSPRQKSRRLHLTKFNTKFKQPDIKNNIRTSMDTCIYRHTWKRSGRSAGKRKKQEPAAKMQTLIRNKRLADFKHSNGGYNPQQDTLRLLSRHEQTMIFRLRTGHCRLRSHMKKMVLKSQPFVTEDWKHKPQFMSCSHALSTKDKEKAHGLQKVP